MKKKYHYTTMSDLKCSCGKRLKKGVVERKTGPLNCYNCYSGARQSGFSDRQARTMRIPRNYRLTRKQMVVERKARRKRRGF
jgi:hypothetical protein